MGARLTDSRQYAHLWGTPELTAIFDEPARLQDWLEILTALAAAQARLGIIPVASAELIAKHADVTLLDLDYVAEQTRLSAHSTLGLIRALQRVLPEPARAHVYFGATVQDVTDTWFALVMRRVGSLVWRDLRAIEESLLALAEQHRITPMLGRTHGQPGAPISFGFKVASWADEVRRHLDRLDQARSRWLVGQLAGAVGVLGFFEPDGLRLRQEFCAELGLADPGISWLTARDRIAEFGAVLALVCGTLARIGNEVYELSRPEVGELREPTTADVVSSITMPHKRNPEASEHLDTLARLVRAHAGVLLEGTVGVHERDGRAWKAEWAALPEVCLLSSVALQTARGLVSGLVVDPAAMLANLHRFGDLPASERVLAGLSRRLGRHQAQQLMHELIIASGQRDIGAAVIDAGAASEAEVRQWTEGWPIDAAATMTDSIVRRAREARRVETTTWP
jgi:adenylosuccinate lyase